MIDPVAIEIKHERSKQNVPNINVVVISKWKSSDFNAYKLYVVM